MTGTRQVVGRLVVATLAVATVVGAGSAAGAAHAGPAATTWTMQTTPSVAAGSDWEFTGVSCPAPAECIAVGGYHSSTLGYERTLAERWRAGAWSIEATADPGPAAFLTGVSCTSDRQCVAVGYWTDASHHQRPFAMRFHGGAWTLAKVPRAAGSTFDALHAVSCLSATDCIAVGVASVSAGTEESPLVSTFNGSTWSSTLLPSSAQRDHLDAVSCLPTSCTAVGTLGPAQFPGGQAWSFDGTAWTPETVPAPPPETGTTLSGVSCTSSSACTAVGNLADYNGTYRPLVEVWDGTAWTAVAFPRNFLPAAVSCSVPTRCVIAGSWQVANTGSTLELVAVSHGAGWHTVSVPVPVGTNPFLDGVTCQAGGDCEAVGEYVTPPGPSGHYRTIAERLS